MLKRTRQQRPKATLQSASTDHPNSQTGFRKLRTRRRSPTGRNFQDQDQLQAQGTFRYECLPLAMDNDLLATAKLI